MDSPQAVECYKQGDFAGALAIWLPAAQAGDADSQAWIGTLYENGQGVAVDEATAFDWYVRSARGGNRLAQNNVGAMYGMGRGVAQDFAKAADWFAMAAEQETRMLPSIWRCCMRRGTASNAASSRPSSGTRKPLRRATLPHKRGWATCMQVTMGPGKIG